MGKKVYIVSIRKRTRDIPIFSTVFYLYKRTVLKRRLEKSRCFFDPLKLWATTLQQPFLCMKNEYVYENILDLLHVQNKATPRTDVTSNSPVKRLNQYDVIDQLKSRSRFPMASHFSQSDCR